jgi:hypothetical protein
MGFFELLFIIIILVIVAGIVKTYIKNNAKNTKNTAPKVEYVVSPQVTGRGEGSQLTDNIIEK